jgi:hypothetical protein
MVIASGLVLAPVIFYFAFPGNDNRPRDRRIFHQPRRARQRHVDADDDLPIMQLAQVGVLPEPAAERDDDVRERLVLKHPGKRGAFRVEHLATVRRTSAFPLALSPTAQAHSG